MATTINTAKTGPLVLAPTDNPLSITNTGSVSSTGTADAIDGDAATTWSITNAGQISAISGRGVSLAGAGTISNSGTIGGLTGVLLSGGGSLSNTATGSISGSAAIGSGPSVGAGVSITGKAGTVDNSGSISGGAYGVAMTNGGTVTNASSIVGGEDGVIILGATGQVSNSSSIVATVDDGVALFAGGTVTNGVNATISSGNKVGAAGIFITAGVGSILNSGSVTSSNIGALLLTGGTVTNKASGTMTGANEGVFIKGASGTVDNAGAINGTSANGTGVYLGADGKVTNAKTGQITGVLYGAFIDGGAGQASIQNYGKITGQTLDGVILGLGGTVLNGAGAILTGATSGVYVKYRAAGTVTNSGTIGGTGTNGTGVDLGDGGSVTNNSGGSVYGTQFGVFMTKGAGSVTNNGAISGTSGAGVALVAGGSVANAAGASISGGSTGVYVESGGTGTVTNSGSIKGTATSSTGVALGAGGSVSNASTGTISGDGCGVFATHAFGTVTNDGSISGAIGVSLVAGGSLTNTSSGTVAGRSIGFFANGGAGSLVNSGSITATATGGAGADVESGGTIFNAAGATLSGSAFGVFIKGGTCTVENAGTISGGTYCIDFADATATNRLIVDPGAVFTGSVQGGGGTLELAKGAAGSISGIGGIGFSNFQTLAVDASANWTLAGPNTAATVLNAGSLSVAASLVATTIDPNSTGTFQLAASSSLEVGSATGASSKILFQAGSSLVVDNAAAFGTNVGTAAYAGPLLGDFGIGDTIDLKSFASAGATFTFDPATGLLQITNASAQTASLDFQTSTLAGGIFRTGSDGASGLSVTLVKAPKVTINTAGGLTKTPLQTISGTVDLADTGPTVALYDNGGANPIGTASVGQDGSWSTQVTLAGDGPHQLVAKDTDGAGNTGTSTGVTFTLDTAPPTIAITSAGGLTKTPLQTITGTVDAADAGTTVALYDNAGPNPIGTASVGQDGSWSTQVTLAGDGPHLLVASDTDAAGNTGSSTGVTFTLDTTPPTIAITTAGGLTNTPLQPIAGAVDVADAGSTVALYDNGGANPVGTASVGQDGSWSTQVTLAGDGPHLLVAKDTDAAGNTGSSTGVTFTLDTTAPGIAITTAGGLTNTPLQGITGTVDAADAGTTVALYDNGGPNPIGTATVGQDGSWSTQVTLAGDGPHLLVAKDTNPAGNTGTSTGVTFTLDTAPPTIAITTTGGLTKTPLQAIAGTVDVADAGTTVALYDNGPNPIATASVAQDGSWSTQVTLAGDGPHLLVAKDTDAAGNTGSSTGVTFTLDTTSSTIAITSPGGLTKTPVQTISGTVDAADPGTSVALYDNGGPNPIGTASVGQDGSWSTQVTLAGDGPHQLVAKDTDGAGNTGTSTGVTFTLDTAPPTIAITSAGGLTKTPLQTITGTVDAADAGTTVALFDNDPNPIGTASVAQDGSWSTEVTLAGDGPHLLVASDTDGAGNTATSTGVTFKLDTTPPAVIAWANFAVVNANSQTGAIETFSGRATDAVDGADPIVYSELLANGATAIVHSGDLFAPGRHTILASATDSAGNTGRASPFSFTIAAPNNWVYGANGLQNIVGSTPFSFINTSQAAGSGLVIVDFVHGTVSKGGQLDATFSNIQGVQLGSDPSVVLGLPVGTDLIYGGTGQLDFYGQGGNDIIAGSTGVNNIVAGSGTTAFYSRNGNDTMLGSATGASALVAGTTASSRDIFFGNGGSDYVFGGAGTTILVGAGGTESLTGGSGFNELIGANKADALGRVGTNVLHGGTGTDLFYAGIGTNLLYEGQGTDTLVGNAGTDFIFGSSGRSFVYGGSGTDVVTTGSGNQYVKAGSGVTVFNDTAANLTAGRFDQIDNFSGGKGTDLYLPTAVHGATTFVAQNGGTAVLTAVNGGVAEIFASNTDVATLQAHTHFTL